MSHESVRGGDATEPAARGRGGSALERVMAGLLVCIAIVVVWRELEPILIFRPVDGVVLGSGVAKRIDFGRRHRTRLAPQVTYRYTVNGERFLGMEYRRTNLGVTRSEAAYDARRHVVGARVQAWYSPLNPADAVLSRRPNLMLFVILLFLGFWWWVYSRVSVARRARGASPSSG